MHRARAAQALQWKDAHCSRFYDPAVPGRGVSVVLAITPAFHLATVDEVRSGRARPPLPCACSALRLADTEEFVFVVVCLSVRRWSWAACPASTALRRCARRGQRSGRARVVTPTFANDHYVAAFASPPTRVARAAHTHRALGQGLAPGALASFLVTDAGRDAAGAPYATIASARVRAARRGGPLCGHARTRACVAQAAAAPRVGAAPWRTRGRGSSSTCTAARASMRLCPRRSRGRRRRTRRASRTARSRRWAARSRGGSSTRRRSARARVRTRRCRSGGGPQVSCVRPRDRACEQ